MRKTHWSLPIKPIGATIKISPEGRQDMTGGGMSSLNKQSLGSFSPQDISFIPKFISLISSLLLVFSQSFCIPKQDAKIHNFFYITSFLKQIILFNI